MRVKVIFILASLGIICQTSDSFPVEHNRPQNSSTDFQEVKYPTPSHQPINFGTDELIHQQSENVRHIIATEQRERQVKKEKAIVAIEDERFPTLEELRVKCQHFSRLFGLTQSGSGPMETYASSDMTERYGNTVTPTRSEYYKTPIIEVTRRPVFIRNKPTFIQKNNGGFYVTATSTGNEITTTKRPFWGSSTSYPRVAYTSPDHSTTKYTSTTTPRQTTTTRATSTTPRVENPTNSTTSDRPKIKIKYTKFEPVILQKTILTDGRVMYHWHRSLPTAALDLPAPIAPIATPVIQPSTYEYPPVPAQMPLSQRYLAPIPASTIEPPIRTTTTTTEKSSWLFVPFSSLFGGSHEEESTTTVENNTAPPSTTSKIISTTSKNILEVNTTPKSNLAHSATEDTKLAQLKLVVPINYDGIDSSLSTQNNRLGYYRKPMGTADVVAPSPSLHVIKTLGIPQTIPRYSLGYTGTGYGLTLNNGITYGGSYGPDYANYQAYSHVPLARETKKFDAM